MMILKNVLMCHVVKNVVTEYECPYILPYQAYKLYSRTVLGLAAGPRLFRTKVLVKNQRAIFF